MNLPSASWYLVYAKPRQEAAATQGLREQGYAVNLRQLRQRRRVRGRLGEVTQPLFPRYLFVAPGHPEQSIAPVDSTPGVQKLVRFGALYLPVEARSGHARTAKPDAIASARRNSYPGPGCAFTPGRSPASRGSSRRGPGRSGR